MICEAGLQTSHTPFDTGAKGGETYFWVLTSQLPTPKGKDAIFKF